MNPGPVESAEHVATGFIDALKAQPAVLALSVANLGMIAFIFYALNAAATFREQSLANQYTLMKETQLLLSKCIVPDQRTKAGPKASFTRWSKPAPGEDPPRPAPQVDPPKDEPAPSPAKEQP